MTNNKIRVLICSPLSLRFDGGGATWIFEVASRLRVMGHETVVLSLEYDAGESRLTKREIQRHLNGIKWLEIPIIRTPFESMGLLTPTPSAIAKLVSIIKKVDVIYFMNAHGMDLLMLFLKLLTKKPVVSGIHAPLFYGSRIRDIYTFTLGKIILRFFDAHHVLNSFYENLFLSWSCKRVHLIPNGVDVNEFKPIESRDPGDRFRVMFIGRLAKQKGVDILCEAIRLINTNTSMKDIEFAIVGTGKLQSLVSDLSEKFDNVKFLGYVPCKQLLQEYLDNHLLIMPSRQENFSLTILEAQATGLPAVVSDIYGLKEAVKTDVNGRLVPPENSKALAEAIQYFYQLWRNDYKRYYDFREASRRNVVENFGWDKVMGKLEQMFIEVATLARTPKKQSLL